MNIRFFILFFYESGETSAGIYQAPENLTGIASALTNTMRQLGGPLGLSILVLQGGQFSTIMLILSVYILLVMGVVGIFMLRK